MKLLFLLGTLFMSVAGSARAERSWERQEDLDRMTDQKRTGIFTRSALPLKCGGEGRPANLYFLCSGNKLTIGLMAPGCVLEGSPWNYRIDREQKSTVSAETGNDPSTAFLTDFLGEGKNQETLTKMLDAKQLLIELHPYVEAPELVEFDLTGLAEEMKTGFEGCLPSSRQSHTKAEPAIDSNGDAEPNVSVMRSTYALEMLVLGELACDRPPSPGPVLAMLREMGKIDVERNIGFDSLSCFEIMDGLQISEVTFSHVCGFEEDEALRDQYPDLFYRGPGTSPGQSLSLETNSEESAVRDWYEQNVRGAKVENGVSSRFPSFGKTEVKCDRWMF